MPGVYIDYLNLVAICNMLEDSGAFGCFSDLMWIFGFMCKQLHSVTLSRKNS